MLYVSSIFTTPPEAFKTPLQAVVYQTLEKLRPPFERADTSEAITMEGSVQINQKQQMNMVKTLFLCCRRLADFYLFITKGNDPFHSKEFSAALGTKIGAAAVFSLLLGSAEAVRAIFDQNVLGQPYYACSDGTTISCLNLRAGNPARIPSLPSACKMHKTGELCDHRFTRFLAPAILFPRSAFAEKTFFLRCFHLRRRFVRHIRLRFAINLRSGNRDTDAFVQPKLHNQAIVCRIYNLAVKTTVCYDRIPNHNRISHLGQLFFPLLRRPYRKEVHNNNQRYAVNHNNHYRIIGTKRAKQPPAGRSRP